MKKKILNALVSATLVVLFRPVTGIAQVDLLSAPSLPEKKEMKNVISEYVHFLQQMSDTSDSGHKKAASVQFLKARLSGANIYVYDDIDSLSPPDHVIPFFKYTQKLSDSTDKNLSMKIDTGKVYIDRIKYDKIRKYYYAEAKAIKIFTLTHLRKKIPNDSILQSDTIHGFDTLKTSYQQKLTFYIKFERPNAVSVNFKIAAISKTGTPARLEPLPELVTWWLGLEEDWKKIFRKKIQMEEYPRASELEKLTGQYELDVANTPVRDLDPLKKFYNLENLNCSNTQVKSLSPIVTFKNLRELNISRTKIDTLAGLEKFSALQKLQCAGNKLKSIAQVKSLKNLIEFDCAENEIEDISMIKELTDLKKLNFSLNIKVKNIEAIKDLINLEWLAMGKIDVRNLESLSGLVNLVHLDLFNTNIDNLSPLRNIPKITYLNLSHNKMNSLDAIKNYKFITELYLASSSIKDLSQISNYQFLRVLDISNTLISGLGPIHHLEDIKVLKAHFTRIGKDEIQRFKKNHPRCQITYY
jgi:internalin A